jgi:hypothetical protein
LGSYWKEDNKRVGEVIMYEYKWEDSFLKMETLNIFFIKKIFKLLNNGVSYFDINGQFIGKINFLHGPLSGITIISDHSLDAVDNRYIMFRALYLDKIVLYLVIVDNKLVVKEYLPGRWASSIDRQKL